MIRLSRISENPSNEEIWAAIRYLDPDPEPNTNTSVIGILLFTSVCIGAVVVVLLRLPAL
jgi:hypothetical protein